MAHTFVIAEAGSCHDNSFTKALRLIDGAKECGADACKFQFWSHPGKLAARRGLGPDAKAVYEKYQLPQSWLPRLKDHCDEAGIEFMCTSYLIEDIEVITPYVKRFKVSAFEAEWEEFVQANFYRSKETIISSNHADTYQIGMKLPGTARPAHVLHCVSKYPTALEDLNLRVCSYEGVDGLSDHTTSTLTGALAVAAGATIIEKHIRLKDTDPACPDYGHSLEANGRHIYLSDPGKGPPFVHEPPFGQYVKLIREAERAM